LSNSQEGLEEMKRKFNRTVLFLGLSALMIGMILISLALGQVSVPLSATLAVLGHELSIPGFHQAAFTPEQMAVIWQIRLPRVLVGLLVGAALGVSGAVMQGVLSNPLADPGIIGVSSGAAFGAVIAVASGISTAGVFYTPSFALLGALLAVALVLFMAMHQGKIPVMVLLLSGVAVSMLLGALTSGILTFMNEARLREFLFWTVGGLDYRRWEHVYLAAPPILVGITLLCLLARHINILVLGEDEARSVGVPVAAFRFIFLFLTTVTTAAAVCVSGTIGFVGLVVPHMMRLLIGPEHRVLLPACALAGGFFLVACDTVGRLVIAPTEVRVGIMTALLGAPYFLYLLRKASNGGILS
jgi:iron complex transport system permease protein